MKPSIYQQRVIDWLLNGSGVAAVVNSVAGSGKSTLLKLAAEAIEEQGKLKISRDCLVLVFNKKNAKTLIDKLGPNWRGSISTVHSAGYRDLRRYLGGQKLIVETDKYRKIAKGLDWFNGSKPKEEKPISLAAFVDLADFVRQTMCTLELDRLRHTIDHYALDIPTKHLEQVADRLRLVFSTGISLAYNQLIIDHTDMLWLPVTWNFRSWSGIRTIKVLFVDEAQDISRLQLEFILSLSGSIDKELFVGDPAQSINGFCGADTDSFSNIKHQLNAAEFVLPTCYRCPTSHIETINRLYPDIPIEPKQGASVGRIETITERDLWSDGEAKLKPGDLIVARKTASLVELHLKLICHNISAHLVGSSLKQRLLDLMGEIYETVEAEDDSYQAFVRQTESYLERKLKLYEDRDDLALLELNLKDNLKALQAIFKQCKCSTQIELEEAIESLFGKESSNCVMLSTIHRAKGMEAARVYIADPLSLPLMWEGQKQWQMQQENNLLYVALSRSTDSMFLIGDAFWYDNPVEFAGSQSSQNPKTEPGSSLSQMITTASNDELEKTIELIKQEQARRVARSFQNAFESAS